MICFGPCSLSIFGLAFSAAAMEDLSACTPHQTTLSDSASIHRHTASLFQYIKHTCWGQLPLIRSATCCSMQKLTHCVLFENSFIEFKIQVMWVDWRDNSLLIILCCLENAYMTNMRSWTKFQPLQLPGNQLYEILYNCNLTNKSYEQPFQLKAKQLIKVLSTLTQQ